MLGMRDVACLRIRRNDEQRDTITEAFLGSGERVCVLRRKDVIVPASPLVPHNDDGGFIPVLALADFIDDRGDPVGSAVPRSVPRMIRCAAVRHYPRYLLQITTRDIGQDVRIRL